MTSIQTNISNTTFLTITKMSPLLTRNVISDGSPLCEGCDLSATRALNGTDMAACEEMTMRKNKMYRPI